ncbi:MAG TPA: acyltransferase [Kofleriaceae bacterium]|jgi:peptidoglycan/LPS O-acetylase OafA/YrhL|nr:acyltransferase [Kofleriaceae bacterium]
MLFNIQVLRAIAALLVIHAHAAGPTGLDLAWAGGANGVDLFFVISGFIIAYVASLDASQFMTRRLLRIVPIYWTSTLALYLLVLAMPRVFHTTSSDPVLLVRSLAFMPTASGLHTPDGIPHPTLSGGWTLNYEMYFYAVFAIALTWSRQRATWLAVALLLAVLTAIQLTPLRESPVACFYGNPIILEFMYGIAAFHVVRWVEARRRVAPALRGEPAALLAGAVLGLAVLVFDYEVFSRAPRWLTYGILQGARWTTSGLPAFVVVVCAVLLERVHQVRITNRWVILTGDASYVMYLIHAYVVFGVLRLTLGNHRLAELPGQLVVLGLMAVSAGAAIAIYRWYEQPILRALKRQFIAPRPAAIRAAAPGASAR